MKAVTQAHPDVERAEALLRPMLPGRFSVTYTPDMPGRDSTPSRWFQVVFAVGPGDSVPLRARIHELFPRMLAALSPLVLASEADYISLRARRFFPDSKHGADHPLMFIEVDWTGSAFRQMRDCGDFSGWGSEYLTYHNHFDRDDPLQRAVA